MHLKVFLKLKKNPKTLSSGQKKPKNLKKPKNPKKKQKNQKNPLGWFLYIKKPGFFPTLPPGRTLSAETQMAIATAL
jgi:hypothetical protein